MAAEPGPERGERRRALAYAAAVAAVAATAIVGWRFDIPVITRISSEYVPIAPSTAVSFLALAAAVVALARWPERRRTATFVFGAITVVVVLAAHVLLQAVRGVDLDLERALCVALGAPQTFPLGRMSPVAAALFLVAAGALAGRAGRVARRRFAVDVSTALAALVLAGGLIFVFGYWLKAPVMYGGTTIPLALPTAVAFVLTGLALLALVGHRIWAVGGRLPALLVVSFGIPVSFGVYAIVEAAERTGEATHIPWHGRVVLLAGLLFTGLLAAYLLALARQRRESENANRALRAAEERLRAVLQTASDAIVTADEDGKIIFWNAAAARIFGYTAEEAAHRNVTDLIPERFRHDHVLNLARMTGGGEARLAGVTVEMPGVRKSGVEVPLELSVARWNVGPDVFLTAMMRDITERTQAEELEAAVLQISQAAGEAAGLGELLRAVHAAVGRLMEARNFYVALLDPETEVVSFPYFVDEADQTPAPRRTGRGLTEYVLRTGVPKFVDNKVFEDLLQRGEIALVGVPSIDWLGVPLLAGGRAIGVIVAQSYGEGTHYSKRELDILTFVSRQVAAAVERRRALDALARSEAQYRAVVEDQTELICRFRPDGVVTFANAASCRFFGQACAAAMGSTFFAILGDENAAPLGEVLASLGPDHPVASVRLSHISPDRGGRVVAWTFRALADVAGETVEFQAVGRDVTDRIKLAAQLQEAQRLEAVAALAGGVAHEFNNDLQAMLATTRLLAAARTDEGAFGVTLGKIEDAIKRSARHTRQLLVFARQDVSRREALDLNELVASSADLLASLAPATVRLEVEEVAGALAVEGDCGQLEQVLANLAVNAVDAMRDGGMLTVRTGRDGAFAWLEVGDTGVGIPEEVRRRLFEPFFTTKQGGTGLGLSVTHGIVTGLGGRIEVASEVGRGSTFRVLLPLRPEGAPALAPPAPAAAPPARAAEGAARLLVVDDEAGAREGLAAALHMLGYHVTPAGSGEEALALAGREAFDLLLSNIKLPGIQGGDLARTLVARHPGLRVILMSGYTEDAAVRAEASSGRVRFLQKPFSMDAVAAEVAAALQP
jgi:PAS domain S-box-containing protein